MRTNTPPQYLRFPGKEADLIPWTNAPPHYPLPFVFPMIDLECTVFAQYTHYVRFSPKLKWWSAASQKAQRNLVVHVHGFPHFLLHIKGIIIMRMLNNIILL